MKYEFNGKTLNIPDALIEKNMKVLELTKEEAIEMYSTIDDIDDRRNVIKCEIGKDKIWFLLEYNGNYAGHIALFFNKIYGLEQINWLNSHHFDYHGLISKGLALEAPEGMYKEN